VSDDHRYSSAQKSRRPFPWCSALRTCISARHAAQRVRFRVHIMVQSFQSHTHSNEAPVAFRRPRGSAAGGCHTHPGRTRQIHGSASATDLLGRSMCVHPPFTKFQGYGVQPGTRPIVHRGGADASQEEADFRCTHARFMLAELAVRHDQAPLRLRTEQSARFTALTLPFSFHVGPFPLLTVSHPLCRPTCVHEVPTRRHCLYIRPTSMKDKFLTTQPFSFHLQSTALLYISFHSLHRPLLRLVRHSLLKQNHKEHITRFVCSETITSSNSQSLLSYFQPTYSKWFKV
jgi:hypothetical protein